MNDPEVELELALLYDYRKRIMDAINNVYASTSIEILYHLLRNLADIDKRIERAPATVTMKKIMRME